MHDDEGEGCDPCDWPRLRRRLRDLIARQRAGRLEVGAVLGIEFPTLVRVLGGDSAEPGRQVIERAQVFLARRAEKLSDDTRASGPGENGAHPPSGNSATSAPHRLDPAQADRLLAYLELTPQRQARRELQMSRELACEAAAGAEIPIEAVQRINAFFEAASSEPA